VPNKPCYKTSSYSNLGTGLNQSCFDKKGHLSKQNSESTEKKSQPIFNLMYDEQNLHWSNKVGMDNFRRGLHSFFCYRPQNVTIVLKKF
jgi:hypothetical protein